MNKKFLFAISIIALAMFTLLSDHMNPIARFIIIVILAGIAFALFLSITHAEIKRTHAKLKEIHPISLMNPNQYISKAGSVCAGSDTRYEAIFELEDMTLITFSISAKEASKLIQNSSGTLSFRENIFINFVTES